MSYITDFNKAGYAGPFSLITKEEGLHIANNETVISNLRLPYVKGRHILSEEMASLASRPEILEKIIPVLGQNIILSGSQIIRQKPLAKHQWHVDIEHTAWEGVTVWLALSNVEREKCFRVISGSHLFNTIPDDLKQHGVDILNDDQLLKEAKKFSADAKLVELNIADGEFIVFAGKTWHGTQNKTALNRYAAIFQYCNTSQKVKVLDSTRLPKVIWRRLVPQCLLVSGTDVFGLNKLLTPNTIGSLKSRLSSLFIHLPKNVLIRQSKRILPKKTLLAAAFRQFQHKGSNTVRP